MIPLLHRLRNYYSFCWVKYLSCALLKIFEIKVVNFKVKNGKINPEPPFSSSQEG
jgi:hypothetical protein